ncbi:MAG: H(+)/Cl(-) exchange transporter ClcA [Campylobacterota bacterium]|nr:H(+)/Cl(-) exchange transporter ClcA [Campylobacterota bacterium]
MTKNENYTFIIMLFLSSIVGLFVGVVGSLFQMGINAIISSKSNFISSLWFFDDYLWIPYMLSSAIMVFLSIYIVKKFAPEAAGSGIQEIEGVLEDKREMRSLRVILVKFFGGIFSLGAGMVMGREGPTVQIGGAFGHIVSSFTKLEKEEIKILIAAGAGAGLAVAFNAPLAGILFVLEEMRSQLKYSYLSFLSVISSVVVGVIVLHVMMGNFVYIPMDIFPVLETKELWIFLIFGAIFGVFGLLFNTLLVKFADIFASFHGWRLNVLTLSIGALIGLLVWSWPQSVGDGFNVISSSFSSSLALESLVILIIVRFIMTLISYGTSAPGGIFAPMLAIGTLFGLWFGIIVNEIFPQYTISPEVFAVVGMSALFSATVRAPLTGIILVVELTQNYNLILPLIITSLIATVVVRVLGGRPIYTILLERTLSISKFGDKL